MATSSATAREYFAALARHDLDGARALWAPEAADQVSERFERVLGAFPDLTLEVLDTTTQRERCVVRWRARGTFIGPDGLACVRPNGGAIDVEGIEVLRVVEGQIVEGSFYADTARVWRQLGVLPPQARLARMTNARTTLRDAVYGSDPEAVAAGVWVMRAGRPRRTNRFLIESDEGLVVFDPGIAQLAPAIRTAAARFGGVARVILSHADSPHRGAAAALGAPVHCHPLERSAAQNPSPYRDYWNFGLLGRGRAMFLTRLFAHMDGGPVQIDGTLEDGDEVAGFKVVHLPGHAPGLIGLWREADGLALVSDCIWNASMRAGLRTQARVPDPALNLDTEQARRSIRRLASLGPRVVWPAIGGPISGDGVARQLDRAAAGES